MNQTQAARLLQEAVGLQRRHRLDEAASLCEQIVARFPQVAEPLQLLGLVRLQQRRLDEAEHFLRESATLAPRRAEFQSSLGNVLAARGKTPEAEYVYQEALQLDATFRPARLGLARLYNRVGLFAAAEEEARILLAATPDDARALSVLGLALQGRGRLGDAEDAFRRALRRRPGYGVVHHNLGRLLARLHRRYEALEQFDAAIAAGVRGPQVGAHRARALLDLDRLDEAVAALERIVVEHPRTTEAHELLARVRHAAGDSDFDRDFAAATREHPDYPPLQRAYARLLCANGDPSVAADVLRGALRVGGAHPGLLSTLAGVHLQLGEFETALRVAREACQVDPADPTLRDAVIEALLTLGRAAEADELIAAAGRRAPDDARYRAWAATRASVLGEGESLADLVDQVTSIDLSLPRGWPTLAEFNADLRDLLETHHDLATPPLDNRLFGGTEVDLRLEAESNEVARGLHDGLLGSLRTLLAEPSAVIDPRLRDLDPNRAKLSRAVSMRVPAHGRLRPGVRGPARLSALYCVRAAHQDNGDRWLEFGRPPHEIPGVGGPQRRAPQPGTVIVFPSCLWHSVTSTDDAAPGHRLFVLVDVLPDDDRA